MMAEVPFFPRRKPREPEGKKCSATDPSQACELRVEAVRSGYMVPDFNMGAWTFPEDPRRRITTEMRITGKYEHDLDPFSHVDCPYCGEPLPSVFILRNPPDCGNSD